MKRFGLVLATACCLLFTAVVLHEAGWFRSRPPEKSSGRLSRQADLRYLQCQPRHWRYCVFPH
jgi:hypothetical protein